MFDKKPNRGTIKDWVNELLKNDWEGGKGSWIRENGRGVDTGIDKLFDKTALRKDCKAGRSTGKAEGREIGTSSPTAIPEIWVEGINGASRRVTQAEAVAGDEPIAINSLFGTPTSTFMPVFARAERRDVSAS